MIQKIKENYHLLIATLVFLEMLVYGGLINSSSVYVQPVSTGLGVSTTVFSLAVMPYTVTCFIGTCLTDSLFRRFGYKRTAIVSLVILSLSLFMSASASNIIVYSISKILFGMSYGACFTAGSVRIVKNWFRKYQGTVLGAVSMSTGLGGCLMTLLLANMIQLNGWRSAYMISAIVVVVIAGLYLLLKDHPEQMGLRPYGYGSDMEQKKERNRGIDFSGYPLREQFKRPMFYLMCMCVLVSCVCLYTTSGFMIPHFISQGFTPNQAAIYQSVHMLTLAVVKVVIGFLYDLFGARLVMIVCMLCAVVGQGILAVTNNPTLCFAAVMFFAAGLCMSSIVIPLIATHLFGHEACLSVNGIFLGLSSLATLFSSPISSLCYDTTGSYTPVYRVTSIILVGILGIYLLIFSLAKQERLQFITRAPETLTRL